MGYGDWIMASGEVKEAHLKTGKKVKLGDGTKMFLDEQVFAYNPRMANKGDTNVTWVANYPGNRPYMTGTDGKRIIFNDDYKPLRGEIYLSSSEILWAKRYAPKDDYILVEPNVKRTYLHTINKSWPYFKELVKADLPFLQVGDANTKPITNFVATESFRQALAILSRAKLFIGTDGALHHAAAALGIPSVVIWTGFTSPKHLGYDSQINIHDGGEPCGFYGGICPHCIEIARNISPERVLEAVEREINRIDTVRCSA